MACKQGFQLSLFDFFLFRLFSFTPVSTLFDSFLFRLFSFTPVSTLFELPIDSLFYHVLHLFGSNPCLKKKKNPQGTHF